MKLYIEHGNSSPKSLAGFDTYVYVVDDDGRKTDISTMVRAADVRLHMGSVVTANLEVFVTGIKSRADLEKLIVREIKSRKRWQRWLRKPREITAFAHRNGSRWFLP